MTDRMHEDALANREERRTRHDEVEESLRAEHLEIATSGSFGAYHYCHCGMWSSLEAGTETFVEHVIQATRDAVAAEIRALESDEVAWTATARLVQRKTNEALRRAAAAASGDV